MKSQSGNFETPSRLINMSHSAASAQPSPEPASPAKSSAPQVKPVSNTSPASNSQDNPEPVSTTSTSPSTQNVQFNSSNIDSRKLSSPDFFAEQNQARAKKQAVNAQKRKITFIVLACIAGVALIGLGIWLVVKLTHQPAPEPEPTPEEKVSYATDVLEEARKNAAENADSPEATEKFFNETLNDATTPAQTNQVLLAQFLYYFNLFDYEKAMVAGDEVKAEELDLGDRVAYYGALAQIYQSKGDTEQASYYNSQAYLIMLELVGTEEEGNEP